MHPILFRIGNLEIHSYGLMLAVSFLLGILWAVKRGEKRGIKQADIMDLSFLIVICAIAGSRILYVITHVQEFQGRWLDTVNPFQSNGQIGLSGLTLLGGVVLSAAAIIIFCIVRKIDMLRLMDVLAPCFGLGIFITRIGCFLNGCCFGRPSTLPWAMKFPIISPAGYTFQGVAIHPAQLYSSLYGLIITGVLVFLDRKKHRDGVIVAWFLVMYGISRFLVDFVRYYEECVQFSLLSFRLTVNQGISLGMLLAGAVLLLFCAGRRSQV